MFVHHAGKGGAQRGTSRREDALDTVICLRHPADYSARDGARFEVHYEKARGFAGDDAAPFEARLEMRDGAAIWTMKSVEDRTTEQIAELKNSGLTQREIARELDIGLGTVNRHLMKARARGLSHE